VDGDLVKDVTEHPAFRQAARSLASLFDIAADPANRERMTFASPRTGAPVLRAYQIPKTHADLNIRRTTRSIRLSVARSFFGRSGPFGHASLEILEIAVHLFKRKSKCEEAFRLVARKAARNTVAPESRNFDGIGVESNFNSFERRRRPARP
jgi:aromatic ring hydroxylase